MNPILNILLDQTLIWHTGRLFAIIKLLNSFEVKVSAMGMYKTLRSCSTSSSSGGRLPKQEMPFCAEQKRSSSGSLERKTKPSCNKLNSLASPAVFNLVEVFEVFGWM